MQVASAEVIINYFKRNNPIEATILPILQFVYFAATYFSRKRVNRFKYLLEIEKLEKMQESLSEGYKPRSAHDKMNKIY